MKDIAEIVLKKAKALLVLGTCSICGGQLAGSLYIMHAVGTAFINSHMAFFSNQKDRRQIKILP